MKFRVLGCSGGIGEGRHTTSFLVNETVLIDAGTGLTRLTLAEMRLIDHLFITHAHMDHILCLPTLLDSVGGDRDRPLQVHATAEVLDALKSHIFNWDIWPDFSHIPSRDDAFMTYTEVQVGATVTLDGLAITPIPANHKRPAVGSLLNDASGSLLFSGDTTSHPDLWRIANATADLRHFIVETSFANAQLAIALNAYHYCPATLLPDLAGYQGPAKVWITHLKPGQEDEIMAEIAAGGLATSPIALVPDQILAT